MVVLSGSLVTATSVQPASMASASGGKPVVSRSTTRAILVIEPLPYLADVVEGVAVVFGRVPPIASSRTLHTQRQAPPLIGDPQRDCRIDTDDYWRAGDEDVVDEIVAEAE